MNVREVVEVAKAKGYKEVETFAGWIPLDNWHPWLDGLIAPSSGGRAYILHADDDIPPFIEEVAAVIPLGAFFPTHSTQECLPREFSARYLWRLR